MIHPPPIDERTGPDLVAQTRKLLHRHTPGRPRDANEQQLADALVHVFARFCEIAINRINGAPGKNYLAFLQLLGVANRPPQAARVPLTFYLAGEGTMSAVVPARTQVAAQPLQGEKDPVLFETDREFVVVATRLTSLFAKDGQRDSYADRSHLLPQAPPAPMLGGVVQPVSPAYPAFTGDTAIPHSIFVSLPISSPAPRIDRLRLNLVLEPGSTAQDVEWQLLAPPLPKEPAQRLALETLANTRPSDFLATATPQAPTQDTTEKLTVSGELVFENIPRSPWLTASGEQRYWVAGRLTAPILSSPASAAPGKLPRVTAVNVSWEANRSNLPLDQAFFNAVKLDLSKDFYPFGERPRFGDTLYLASNELFAHADAEVTLSIQITNPANSTTPASIPPVNPDKVRLAWEFWDGTEWGSLGTSGDSSRIRLYSTEGSALEPDTFTDGTNAFSTDGDVSFRFPRAPQPTTVNGKPGFWVRVRIVAGNYGLEAHRERELVGTAAVAATFAPPVLCSIKASYTIYSEFPPQSVTTYNDFTYGVIQPGTPFQPFVPVSPEQVRPALYFGFTPPTQPSSTTGASVAPPIPLSSRSMSIYIDAKQSAEPAAAQPAPTSGQALRWEYFNGTNWTPWTVRDETDGLRQPGLIRFLPPPDVQVSSEFGLIRFWLRAVPAVSPYPSTIRMALLNTIMASAGTTLINETLGVSNGTPLQIFRLLRTPVLEGQHLEILESRMPSHAEQLCIRADEGEDAIRIVSRDNESEIVSVRWHQVDSPDASDVRDRHYGLDPLTGVVTFGDGINGQIPRRGAKVTATRYRAGGGALGNRPAWNIIQLKTAIPSIGKVCNWIPAGGGGDAETNDALTERGSRGIRHSGRAVAAQDFEDLARMASPEVARAKCIPLLPLTTNLTGTPRPGCVGVLVAPWSTDPQPQPGSQLIECVKSFLRRASSPTIELSIAGPEYLPINVATQIVVRDPNKTSDIELAVKLALTAFLHPLTGRSDGSGWGFGRKPHTSEFNLLIGSIPGVSYVRDIQASAAVGNTTESSGLFLVSPGSITVTSLLDT